MFFTYYSNHKEQQSKIIKQKLLQNFIFLLIIKVVNFKLERRQQLFGWKKAKFIFLAAFGIFIILENQLINASLDVDNGIIGTPQVECEREFVHFKVQTKKTFFGRVYVKGEFDNSKCIQRSTLNTEKNEGIQQNLKNDDKQINESKIGNKATENEWEDVDTEETIHQLLEELKRRKNVNSAQIPIPSHFPAAGSAEQLKRWRSFLTGKPGLDGQWFKRYGSKLSPDSNGECPLICPPCDDCNKQEIEETTNPQKLLLLKKRRRSLLNNENNLNKNIAELWVRIGECNTRRDKIADPPGTRLSFTVVVSFHPNFITRVDRAYNIQCAYQEPERTLSAQIDVSPPPVIPISNQMQPPQCSYQIHGQKTTEQVQNVQVGETLEHEWTCRRNVELVESREKEQQRLVDLYGLLVHDCFVDDGKNRRAQVLDSRGCSLDPLILQTPIYDENSLKAYVLSAVAKFPDGDMIGFQCSITVCLRDSGRCDGITPPQCSPVISDSFDNAKRVRRDYSLNKSNEWELHSPLITVFDPIDQNNDFKQKKALPLGRKQFTSSRYPPEFCLSVLSLCAFVSISTFLVTVISGAILIILFFHDPPLPMLDK